MVGRKLHRSSADGSQPPSRRHSIQLGVAVDHAAFFSPSCFFSSFFLSRGCTHAPAGASEINLARNRRSRSRQKISSAVGLGSSERASDGVMDDRRDLSIGTCYNRRPGGLAARAMGVSLRRRNPGSSFRFFGSPTLREKLFLFRALSFRRQRLLAFFFDFHE